MGIDYSRPVRSSMPEPAPAGPGSGEPTAPAGLVPWSPPGPTLMPPPTSWMDFVHGPAQQTLDRITRLLTAAEVRYVELEPSIMGVGIGVAYGETDFTIVSVLGSGNENHVNLTCGVLRDVRKDQLLVLAACNALTQDRVAYPFYLHDAPIGWDVLVGTSFPIQLLLEAPAFLLSILEGLPQVAAQGREILLSKDVAGVPFVWAPADQRRILMCAAL